MKKQLTYFYSRNFNEFRKQKEAEGYRIKSIIDYKIDITLIERIDPLKVIVDITALCGYSYQMQAIAEELLKAFDDSVLFIADIKHQETFDYELRYCFTKINYWKPENDKLEDNALNLNTLKSKHRKITDLSEDELNSFFDDFKKSLYGHEKFKVDFFELIKIFRLFNGIKEHKILSLFLLGESGVGKTEVANSIYKSLGGKKKLAKVNFGNYSSEFSLSSLIGSARGYIGSEDGEIFIRVRDTDIGIILIDEFEKSNAALFNYFLDVLESGKLISSLAEEIDLDGFIIVFTSNISVEDFYNKISPELRSRFDYKCRFTSLYDEDKEKYVEFRVNSIVRKLNEKYNKQLDKNLYKLFLNEVNVCDYKNMRDLNKTIKKVFIDYIDKKKIDIM